MTNAELVEKVKTAYKALGKIPSRGVRSEDVCYANASQVLINYLKIHPDKSIESFSEDWWNVFAQGFEWASGEIRGREVMVGFEQGMVIATEIFNWPESPNIYHAHITKEIDRDKLISNLLCEVNTLKEIIKGKNND